MVLFWNEVEKIKRLQVIAEFTDDSDKNHEPNPAHTQSPNNSDNDDSDSDNTPRSPDSPPKSYRKHPKSSRKNKHIEKYNPQDDIEHNDNVIINLQNVPQSRNEAIQTAQDSFKNNFNNSNLRTSIENNITENVKELQENIEENIEENVDEALGDLSKEIHSNLKKMSKNIYSYNMDIERKKGEKFLLYEKK